MSIQQLPLQPSIEITPEAPAAEALHIMLERKVNHVAVCTNGRFVGLVSIFDILKQLLPGSVRQPDSLMDLKFAGDSERLLTANLHKLESIRVADMLQPVAPLADTCPLLEAALRLYQSAGPLAVVDADGRLKGMLSRRVFVEYLTTLEDAPHA